MRKNNGFSLVEMVVVIAVIAVLSSIIAPAVIKKVEEANKSKALQEAQVIYESAQKAILNAKIETAGTFNYAIKFKSDTDGDGDVTSADDWEQRCGRFTNKSLNQYINGISSSNKSADTDHYIAAQLAAAIPGASSQLEDSSPIDDHKTTKYMYEHSDTYGQVVFAMAYTQAGEILYFNCIYDGYFIDIDRNGEATVEQVSDSTYFKYWPTSGDRLDYAAGW